VLSTQQSPTTAPSLFETKSALMQQLDHMQLANEELLVKNKVVSSASASDPYRNNAHRALGHVAAAQRASAALVPAPEGGYRSVAERLAADDATARTRHHPVADPSARWADANDLGRLGGSGGAMGSQRADLNTTPLRRWATDHANLIPSTRHQSTLPKAKLQTDAAQQLPNFVYAPTATDAGYDARKKWSGVSFTTGGGDASSYGDRNGGMGSSLQALSQSAADYMHPDPSAFAQTNSYRP
jgi:hypothetical protein